MSFCSQSGSDKQGRTLGGCGGGVRHPPNIFRVGPKLDEKSVHDNARIVGQTSEFLGQRSVHDDS